MMESGSNWLVMGWNLSTPQCQSVTSNFQLIFISIREDSNETLNCNINATHFDDGPKFVFNTTSKDCGKSLTLSPCSTYQFLIIPEIFGTLYEEYSDSVNGTTLSSKSTLIYFKIVKIIIVLSLQVMMLRPVFYQPILALNG